ncbi:hypothetical protein QEG73_20260 [Chitinophagaceae bacterium 26-R-25]|nr:hypothetical protein [Chitinophagaceae bacterium 26-R-25]
MKHRPLYYFPFLALMFAVACSNQSHITTTWKNPSFAAAPPGKLVVYAKISEPAFRNQVEDKVVQIFKSKGYDAIAAHSNFSDNDLKERDSLRVRAQSLNATSLITLRPLKKATEVRSTSQTATSTGFGGSYGGFYNGFNGAPLPISGSGKIEEHLIVETDYYVQGSNSAAWLATIDANMKKGLDAGTTELIEMLIKKMQKEKVL